MLHEKNNIEYTKVGNTQIRQLLKESKYYEEYHRHFDTYYTLFSKVEHFGLIFFRWNNTPLGKKEESIYKAIGLCMIHYYDILTLLFVSNLEHDFIIERIKSFNEFFKATESETP